MARELDTTPAARSECQSCTSVRITKEPLATLRTSLLLPDGNHCRVDDHIYVLNEIVSEPFIVARIMEFPGEQREGISPEVARVNWYYRPRDVSQKQPDPRIVYATMHSDIIRTATIMGSCFVKHKHHILDLDEYKQMPDHFYFDRLFDKFLRRQYAVLPVCEVKNVPIEVRQVLQQHWKYVFIESNHAKDLATEHRICHKCAAWCAVRDSVQCILCQANYHLRCVRPPLPRKPSRGFAWTCSMCSRQEAEDDSDSVLGTEEEPECIAKANMEASRSTRGDSSTVRVHSQIESVSHRLQTHSSNPGHPVVHNYDGWPYRYLGIHCDVADTMAGDNQIYPRAATRIGTRYQVTVQDWTGSPLRYSERSKRTPKPTLKAMKGFRGGSFRSSAAADASVPLTTSSKMETTSATSKSYVQTKLDGSNTSLYHQPIYESDRGSDATSCVLWTPIEDFTAIAAYERSAKNLAKELGVPVSSTDFLDTVMQTLYQCRDRSESAIFVLREKLLTLLHNEFPESEKAVIIDSLHNHPNDFSRIGDLLPHRRLKECIKQIYLLKGPRSLINAEQSKDSAKNSTKHTSLHDLNTEQNSSFYRSGADLIVKDISTIPRKCDFCHDTSSKSWSVAPQESSGEKQAVLCYRCATLWQKYAVKWQIPRDSQPKDTLSRKTTKRKLEPASVKESNKSRPLKHVVQGSSSKLGKPRTLTNIEKSKFDTICAVCRRTDTRIQNQCRRCGLTVHSSCYGGFYHGDTMTCSPCAHMASLGQRQGLQCILCNIDREVDHKSSDVLLRTTGRNWIHLTCAVFHTPALFPHVGIEPVGNTNQISRTAWTARCHICDIATGACVFCTQCDRSVHVECAVRHNYSVGFELQPIKSSLLRKEGIRVLKVGDRSGRLFPVIYCPEHDLRRTSFLALQQPCDGNVSAMWTYINTYKRRCSSTRSLASLSTFLREHYSQVGFTPAQSVATKFCQTCGVDCSPAWFPWAPQTALRAQCLRCHLSQEV